MRAHKRDDESITDTILRLTEDERAVLQDFEVMAELDGFRAAVTDTDDEPD